MDFVGGDLVGYVDGDFDFEFVGGDSHGED